MSSPACPLPPPDPARPSLPQKSIPVAPGGVRPQVSDAFEHCAYGIAVGDPATHRISFCNPAFARAIGRTVEEVAGLPIPEVYAPEDRARVGACIAEADRTGAAQYDARMLRKDGSLYPVAMELVSVRDEQGAVAYRVASLRDISRRLDALQVAQESAERFRRLFENSLDAVLETTPEGAVLAANPAACALFGRTEDDICQCGRSGLVDLSDPRLPGLIAERARAGRVRGELRFVRQDGTTFEAELSAALFVNLRGQPRSSMIIRDLTAHQQAASALQKERFRLANIIEGTRAGTWEWNVQTGETVFNEIWARMLGYELAELMPTTIKTWERLVHPDDLRRSSELLARHFAGELPYYECECRLRHKAGHWIWVLDRGRIATRTADGRPLLVLGAHTEITASKEIQEALRERETRLSAALDAAQMATFDLDFATGRAEWSPRHEAMWGYAPGEFDGTQAGFERRVHAEDLPGIRVMWDRCVATGEPFTHEYRIVWPDGSVHWMSSSGRVAHDETGRPQSLRGVIMDITDRKRMEVEQRARLELQERLAKIALTVPGMIYSFRMRPDGSFSVPYSTPVLEELCGLRPEEVREDFSPALARLLPDDLDRFKTGLAASAATLSVWNGRFRVAHPTKGERWLEGRSIPHREPDGCVIWHGYLQDVTESELAVAALRESEDRFRRVVESAPDAIFIQTKGKFAFANPAALTLFGAASSAQIVGSPVIERFVPEHRARIQARIRALNEHRLEQPMMLQTILRPDGTRCDAEVTGVPFVHGGCEGALVFARDITARQRAEDEVIKSERKYRMLHEGSHEAIITADPQSFAFLTCNPAAVRMFGATSATALAASRPTDLSPERQPDGQLSSDLVREIGAVIPAEGLPSFEWKFRRLDGGEFFADVSLARIVWDDQPVVMATLRDITARKQAELALRESESRYRNLFESNQSVMLLIDPASSAIVDANPAACEFYGWSRAEMQRLRISDLNTLPPEQVKAKIERAHTAQEYHFQLQHRLAKGLIRDVEVFGSAISFAGRSLLFSIIHDITERKTTEVALQASEARYRNLVETSFDWVWEIDTEGRYSYASPRVRELLGYEPAEVLGRTPFDFMPDAEARRVGEIFAALVRDRRPFTALENVNRHRDGHLVYLETSGMPVFAADGTWLGYCGMDRDITVRRKAEGMLRLQGAALEAAANAIVITDRAGTIEWANPAFTALSGWPVEEAVGRNPRELVKSGQHDAEFYRHMWDTILAGRVWHSQIVNRRKDGELRTEEITITPLPGESGEPGHFIAIKQDITARKAMEERFHQAQRMEAIGTLAGGIAHDLNNILTPITLVSGLLNESLTNDADRELLAMVQSGAKRGAEIVKQLLTFSRGQQGERIVVQPRHLMKELMAMMRETFPRELDLRQQFAADLWNVNADPTQLHQVLLNLCVNARDAMPDGGRLTIGARNRTLAAGDPDLLPGAKPGPYVAIEVTDTGHGIPPEIREKIFDPFFTTKPIGKGTGLGLSTVLGIVRSHGGFVTVDSTPGQGSTFRVCLPGIPQGTETAVETPPAHAMPPARATTILVVDDERDVRDATCYVLESGGYRVLTASNGADALTQYLQHRAEIRLVLTDLMMPVMNGQALIRALRAIDSEIKIIAATGLTEAVDLKELTALGVYQVLAKPQDGRTVLDALHRCLTGG